jgi:hypothetical protein
MAAQLVNQLSVPRQLLIFAMQQRMQEFSKPSDLNTRVAAVGVASWPRCCGRE